MFSNFAWSEMLVIAVVAIIVVGPKDLPGMLRQLGKMIGGVKRMAGDFQKQFNDAIKEADLDDLKDLTSTKGFNPLEDARKSMEELQQTLKDPMQADPQVEVAPPKQSDEAASTKTAQTDPSHEKTVKPVRAKTTATKTAKAAKPAKSTSAKAKQSSAATKKPAAARKSAPKKASAAKPSKTTPDKSKPA